MFKKLFKFGKKKEENKEIEEEVKLNEVESNEEDTQNKENLTVDEVSEVEDQKENISSDNEQIEEMVEEQKEEVIEENIKEIVEEDLVELDKKQEEAEIEELVNEDIIEKQENIEELDNSEEEIIEVKGNEEVTENEEVIDNQEVVEKPIEEAGKKASLFDRLKQGLTKAKQGITDRIDDVLKSYTKVDEELLEELEEILITADVGVNTTMNIVEQLRNKIKQKGITNPMDVRVELKAIVEEILTNENSTLDVTHSPTIILMIGVNGVGKTTTIGKLANR